MLRSSHGLLSLLVAVASCAAPAPETANTGDLLPAVGDLGRVGDAGDLAAVDLLGVDLAGPDLASTDLSTATDLKSPDLSVAPDLFHPDLLPGCTPGGACTVSGNVGACAAGTIVCTSGSPVCTANVTTQSCYTGPAGTAGKGVCKAGTQSCVGGLGTCMGQVLPTPESCFNSTDDDCDGVVNNTCPIAVSTGTPSTLAQEGGTDYGTAGSSSCDKGSVVVGWTLADDSNPWLGGVQVDCAPLTLVTNASSYSIGYGAVTQGAKFYSSGATTSTDYRCPSGQSSAAVLVFANDKSENVSGAFLDTGSWTLTLGTTNAVTASWVSSIGSGEFTIGFYYENSGDSEDYDACPAGSALVGFNLYADDRIDGLQAICAPLTFTYR